MEGVTAPEPRAAQKAAAWVGMARARRLKANDRLLQPQTRLRARGPRNLRHVKAATGQSRRVTHRKGVPLRVTLTRNRLGQMSRPEPIATTTPPMRSPTALPARLLMA